MVPVMKILVGVLLMFGIVYVVPERVVTMYMDKEEVGVSKLYVSRHGRKSGYLLNLEGCALKPWYNNITMHLIFYEYLHNEYRRSFVEMKNKFCDWLKADSYIGVMFKNTGVICPAFCMKVVPERASIVYVDKTVFESAKLYVSRHGRKSDYLINLEGYVLKQCNNNITVHFVFYEFLHNEYRRSFVEMHFKLCDFLHKDAYIGGMFKKYGVECPVYGEYHLVNMSFPTEKFPYVVPFDKFRVEAWAVSITINSTILHVQFDGHFSRK